MENPSCRPSDAIRQLFDPAFLAAIPFTQVKPLFERLHKDWGLART